MSVWRRLGRKRTSIPWSPENKRRPPAPGMARLVQPSPGMVAYTEASLLLGIVIGAGMRLRIYYDSPMRSVQPVLWFLHGLTEDVAIFAMAGALALLSTRYVWQRRSWSALTGFILLVCVLHLVWSEIVVFFGHAVRARDLQVGLRPVLFLRSVNLNILYTFTAAVFTAWLLVRWAQGRSRRRSQTWATAARLFALGLFATGLSFLAVPIHQTETARNPLVAMAILVHEWPPTDSQGQFLIPKPTLSELNLRHLAPHPKARAYYDDAFPLAYRPSPRSPSAPTLPPGLKPNLVFIVMEGLRSEEIGAYGGTIQGLTPNLDRLAKEGTRVDRFYSNGNHTPEGEIAIWYGLMPSPYEVVMTTRFETPMTGLPELLQRAGWKTFLWIHNGDQNFYRRDRFYLPRGFITIDGRDFPPSEPRTNWGFSDRALARRAVTAFDSTAEPFASMVLTVSNHHPFQLPSDAQTHVSGLPPERRGFLPFAQGGKGGLVVGMHTVPMLKTMHYTDEAIGYFFELARTRPWFARTVFVIASDHGLPIAPVGELDTLHRFLELRHRVPLILYSPLLPGGKVIREPASQIDILPTIAGLFGIPGEEAGVGRDLLDPETADPDRPVITWTRDARTISVITQKRIYHRQLSSEGQLRFDDAEQELVINPLTDPEGINNLAEATPIETSRLAREAETYFDAYSWLVAQGRSGLPSLPSKAKSIQTAVRKGSEPSPLR